jgi:LPS export ABC transporter protein LptC
MINKKIQGILLFLLLLFFLYGCNNNVREVMKFPSLKLTPSQTADSVEFMMADSASLKIILTAPRVLMFTENVYEPYTILPKGVHVYFYGDEEDNRANTELSADYAVRYEWSRKTDLKNNVIVKNHKGEVLKTDHLIWDEIQRKILTTDYVEITTADRKLIGYGLESNDDFTRYSIKNIQAEIFFNENEEETD